MKNCIFKKKNFRIIIILFLIDRINNRVFLNNLNRYKFNIIETNLYYKI